MSLGGLIPNGSNPSPACALAARRFLAGALIGFGLSLTPPAEADNAAPLGLGTPLDAVTLSRIDIDILPDGRGLPPGSGTVAAGRQIYAEQCEQCHGLNGQGGPYPALAGHLNVTPKDLAADRTLPHTIGNYWGYATTVFDYIRRAMPFDRPGSLGDDAVYAVTAYLLLLNGVIAEDAIMDATTLPAVTMPAHQFYQRAIPSSHSNRQATGSEDD